MPSYVYRAAVQQDQIWEELEEALIDIRGDGKEDRTQRIIRAALAGLTELRQKATLAVRYGFDVDCKMLEPIANIPGLTKEEEKRLKIILQGEGMGAAAGARRGRKRARHLSETEEEAATEGTRAT